VVDVQVNQRQHSRHPPFTAPADVVEIEHSAIDSSLSTYWWWRHSCCCCCCCTRRHKPCL